MTQAISYMLKGAVGVAMAIFGYCDSPGNVSDILNAMVSNPCSVKCGLLSYLGLSGVLPGIGAILVAVGGFGIISLFAATYLQPLFAVASQIMGYLAKLGGRSASTGSSGGIQFGSIGGGSLATNAIIALIGGALATGQANDVARAFFSIVSGAGTIALLYILDVIYRILNSGAAICGG